MRPEVIDKKTMWNIVGGAVRSFLTLNWSWNRNQNLYALSHLHSLKLSSLLIIKFFQLLDNIGSTGLFPLCLSPLALQEYYAGMSSRIVKLLFTTHTPELTFDVCVNVIQILLLRTKSQLCLFWPISGSPSALLYLSSHQHRWVHHHW